jgi:hypothetical protein
MTPRPLTTALDPCTITRRIERIAGHNPKQEAALQPGKNLLPREGPDQTILFQPQDKVIANRTYNKRQG